VNGGNSGLEVVFADLVADSGMREMKQPAPDHRLVPARSILVFESQNVAAIVNSRG